jgi:hypothetical protein
MVVESERIGKVMISASLYTLYALSFSAFPTNDRWGSLEFSALQIERSINSIQFKFYEN